MNLNDKLNKLNEIEKLQRYYAYDELSSDLAVIIDKINELVEAVNELKSK